MAAKNEQENIQSPRSSATNASGTSPTPAMTKGSGSPSPQPSSQNAAINRRSRKNSVQMACERCRRRKIKCSGLPGPCSTCRSLGTVCHDPVKRRDRAQSLLENRIQRLESFAAHGRTSSHSEGMASLTYRPSPNAQPSPSGQHETRYGLHIETENLTSYMDSDATATNHNSPVINPSWDYFAGSLSPLSPACYSDIGPDLAPWLTIDYQQHGSDGGSTPNPAMHKRSHTFPTVTHDEYDWNQDSRAPESAGAFSDIPSIEVTSPDCSRPQSPFNFSEQDLSPQGISIPYAAQASDHNEDDYLEGNFELPRTPPLFATNTRFNDGQIDYYGDYLSPVDKPPTISRRSSMASSCSSNLQVESFPSLGARLHRSQTLPSNSNPRVQADQERLNTTVSSPRTRNYLQVYFQKVHPHSPILNPAMISSSKASQNSLTTYQILLAAAVGALIHHQSRALSSPYVRLAMSLNSEIDFWSSISGVHCAILLAIYCMYEETLSFKDEMDHEDPQHFPLAQPLHPRVNLWLHTCQICVTCIDLGFNLGYLSGSDIIAPPRGKEHELVFFPETASEIEMEAIFRNTFRVAYVLDKRVSTLKQRPRSMRDESLHPDLIRLYMLESVNL
ncbi:uncharacterized protein A1O9_01107 [Exophiala aquamarina CBS 119918]|uniref:Zn(2)-C6 fungal-type domain-containing protein n=1 Tax=Exophiala aquamarina CBS 119918 TaxID=1182545 RepID=A0A072PTC7_9EURO|nr:uncharacterized protein A1O9_01107 [Exophiala aquamarina CBS 119918]KEF63131.1 hypothetical protein A1O9_01107 [Exophiala aquamarina CBS 119918]